MNTITSNTDVKSRKTSRVAALAAAGLLALGPVAASAQPAAPAAQPPATQAAPQRAAPAAGTTMNFQQVAERVVTLGYTDIREIERESDKLYEVKALDAQGRRIDLVVDARTGEVLREKQKR